MKKAITKEGITVRAGQTWRDLDKRMRGRTVIIEAVFDDGEYVRVKGARTTTLAVRRMYRHSTGWELVK